MSTTHVPPQSRPTAGHPTVPAAAGTVPAAAIGIVAVAVTLAGAQLLARLAAWAGLVGPASAPFDSLGAAFIAVTPAWLKDAAIAAFGQHDKTALAVGIVIVGAVAGAGIGIVARRRLAAGMGLAAGLAVVAAVAIRTRPAAGLADLVPLALATAAGLALLRAGLRPEYDDVLGWGPPPPDPRRRVRRLIGLGAASAVVAGVLARLAPTPVDVAAERAAVTLPPVPDAAGSSDGAASADAAGSSSAGSPSGAAIGRQAANIVIPPTLPYGANPDVADLTPFVTPASSFYRVDTAFTLPRVATATWKLAVHGMVRHPLTIAWADLLAMPQIERWITLACVSNEVGGNLVGNAAWQGVRVASLLARAQPLPGADCVYSTSVDHFTVTTPLDTLTDGRDAMLAIGMNGAPLPLEHGFPVRLVVPGLYGYVSATKWVVDLELTTFAKATAYWTEEGWAARAPIKTASRIDTPGYGVTLKSGVVPVAGVAWAQHRGISAVEVQVDDGPWRRADLAGTASADTWVQWVYRWDTTDVASGSHHLTCRAIDAAGAVQTATVAPPAPNGASGYHSIHVVTA